MAARPTVTITGAKPLTVGQSLTLTATARDIARRVVSAARVAWQAAPSDVIALGSVSAKNATVQAVKAGTVKVTAVWTRSDGRRTTRSVNLTVTGETPVEPPAPPAPPVVITVDPDPVPVPPPPTPVPTPPPSGTPAALIWEQPDKLPASGVLGAIGGYGEIVYYPWIKDAAGAWGFNAVAATDVAGLTELLAMRSDQPCPRTGNASLAVRFRAPGQAKGPYPWINRRWTRRARSFAIDSPVLFDGFTAAPDDRSDTLHGGAAYKLYLIGMEFEPMARIGFQLENGHADAPEWSCEFYQRQPEDNQVARNYYWSGWRPSRWWGTGAAPFLRDRAWWRWVAVFKRLDDFNAVMLTAMAPWGQPLIVRGTPLRIKIPGGGNPSETRVVAGVTTPRILTGSAGHASHNLNRAKWITPAHDDMQILFGTGQVWDLDAVGVPDDITALIP